MSKKWDERFMHLACFIGQWSKDPSTKVGAVLARDDHSIISVGFNGFPRAIEDTPEKLNDRGAKYARVIHAEANAIRFAGGQDLSDSSLYVHGLPPCHLCAPMIVQYEIPRVAVQDFMLDHPERGLNNRLSHTILIEGGVKVDFI